MKWITRERPKIDRLACPWLIKRFIDQDAEIIYVPFEQVITRAAELNATPFDIPDVEYTHYIDQYDQNFSTSCHRVIKPVAHGEVGKRADVKQQEGEQHIEERVFQKIELRGVLKHFIKLHEDADDNRDRTRAVGDGIDPVSLGNEQAGDDGDRQEDGRCHKEKPPESDPFHGEVEDVKIKQVL